MCMPCRSVLVEQMQRGAIEPQLDLAPRLDRREADVLRDYLRPVIKPHMHQCPFTKTLHDKNPSARIAALGNNGQRLRPHTHLAPIARWGPGERYQGAVRQSGVGGIVCARQRNWQDVHCRRTHERGDKA